ncbi:MAG TPA: phosphoserine transaminase [Actinomyces sp.]|jgi:phosphoserine aminotransferase|nr:phosphoserine transaminase [Acidobacteriota bacterium]HHT41578.1 phosphoserine transaminase [Actinomyces sp.]
MTSKIQIPHELLPADGRFGSGPSLVRDDQIQRLVDGNTPRTHNLIMGTSHRQAPVKDTVAEIRDMLARLFSIPEGYEVVLGNGGSTAFWAVAVTSLIETRSAHATFGEFGNKFYDEAARAPFVSAPKRFDADPGKLAKVEITEGADVYAWPHHETSTGVVSDVERVTDSGLMVVDATSIAGGIEVDISQTDAYYFAPQKCFGSDGGIWFAILSPAAQERAEKLHKDSSRWMPQILDLSIAISNSVKNQTLNTPALATLLMMHAQLEWMLAIGGLEATAKRSRTSTSMVYEWAEKNEYATPFVRDPQLRSPVVATIDFEGIDAAEIASTLRHNGIVDVEPYRKLGRNQLRIGAFPSVEPDDVAALLKSIDYVIEQMQK